MVLSINSFMVNHNAGKVSIESLNTEINIINVIAMVFAMRCLVPPLYR